MSIRVLLAVLSCAAFLVGCSSPPLSSVALPPVPPNKARFFIFRGPSAADETGIWTSVSLNHREIGSIAPASVFYRDVPPGIYEIEVNTPERYPHQFKTVFARAGVATYVEIESLGTRSASTQEWTGTTFRVNVFDPAIGWQVIAPLQLTSG